MITRKGDAISMLDAQKKEILKKSTLFEGLPDEQIDLVAALTIERGYGRGETIFFEGENADGFYIVSEGLVKVYKTSLMGKEQILHIFGAGEPIGEVAVFGSKPFPASAETLENSRILYFRRNDFIEMVTKNPSISMNMLAVMSLRLRQFTTQIENLSLKEVPARLAGYLVYAVEEQKGGNTLQLAISKGQLASLLGTIPETLSRIFAKMSDEGLIKVEGKRIEILDMERLVMKK